jgi:hypothetical protein
VDISVRFLKQREYKFIAKQLAQNIYRTVKMMMRREETWKVV